MKPSYHQTRDEAVTIRQLADDINAANGVVITPSGSLEDVGRRGIVAYAETGNTCLSDDGGHFHGSRLKVTFYDPRVASRLLLPR